MKLSKSLLSAMAVGLALCTTTTSCTGDFLIPTLEDKGDRVQGDVETEGTCEPNWEDCPACGMG